MIVGYVFSVLFSGENITEVVGYIEWSVNLYTQELGNVHVLVTVKVCNLVEGRPSVNSVYCRDLPRAWRNEEDPESSRQKAEWYVFWKWI